MGNDQGEQLKPELTEEERQHVENLTSGISPMPKELAEKIVTGQIQGTGVQTKAERIESDSPKTLKPSGQ